MKKNKKILLIAVVVYAISIILLTGAEKAGGHDIGFGNAVWYSLITMTSVGYGDITPSSVIGKCIGILYALCSIGILVALVGMGIHVLEEQVIPSIRLFMNRTRQWYVFTGDNNNSVVLAESLKKEEPNWLPVFVGKNHQNRFSDAVYLRMNFEEALAKLKAHNKTSVFCLGDDPWDNLKQGVFAASRNFQTYCLTNAVGNGLPNTLHQFSLEEALSRWYWQNYPLKKSESVVVLVGCGRCGSAMLERALLTNVYESGRKVTYHVFGDATRFCDLHRELVTAMSGSNEDDDSLIFHRESWTSARDLLLHADRIILCLDTDEENADIYSELKKWFVSIGTIHVRLEKPIDGMLSFGSMKEFLTPELVMKDALNRQAILMNDIYNEGSSNPTQWQDLSRFLQESNIAAADHLLVKVRYLLEDDELTSLTLEDCRRAYEKYLQLHPYKADVFREMEHRRWMRFSQMYNWKYSPVRNNALRHHPLLLPYDQLPEEERKKDDFAWEMLGKLDF